MPGPLDREIEPVRRDRFEQVVEGASFKGLDRIVVEGRHEDDVGQRFLLDRGQHLEPIQLRHLDIEQHEVGVRRVDDPDCLTPVSRFAYQLEGWMPGEKPAELVAGEGFVIHDHGPNRRHLSVAFSDLPGRQFNRGREPALRAVAERETPGFPVEHPQPLRGIGESYAFCPAPGGSLRPGPSSTTESRSRSPEREAVIITSAGPARFAAP